MIKISWFMTQRKGDLPGGGGISCPPLGVGLARGGGAWRTDTTAPSQMHLAHTTAAAAWRVGGWGGGRVDER